MFTELGEPGQALKSVNGMGVVHLRRRELHEAATRFTQTADLARQSGEPQVRLVEAHAQGRGGDQGLLASP